MAASALAEPPTSTSRLWLTYGGAARGASQNNGTLTLGGASLSDVHLSAAHFFDSHFGVDLEGRGELFYAKPVNSNLWLPQPSFDIAAMAAGRLLPARWLSLELQLGWGFSQRSALGSNATGLVPLGALFTGPSLGLSIGLTPLRTLSGAVYARVQPFNFGLGSTLKASTFSVGLQASLGAFHVGPAQLGVGASLEFLATSATTTEFDGAQNSLRLGVGLSVLRWMEEPVPPKPVVPPLRGRVLDESGAAVEGARVTLDDGLRASTDASGAFVFAEVPRGKHVLVAKKEGLTPGRVELSVPASGAVVVKLGPPTGPGRVSGVVRTESGPLAGAEVLAVETQVSAKSDVAGRYVLAKVGPGPVTVQVKAEGFTSAEEIAQVAPGGEASLDFVLVPKTTVLRATLRGLLRAKSGEALKGTVRLVELKQKLEVKSDGRFSIEVPSGKYTLIIEARGFVTQTRVVEVSGGDQAIFHAELERLR